MKHINQIIAEMMAAGKLPVAEYRTDSAVGALAARTRKPTPSPVSRTTSQAGASARVDGYKKTS
jgi:hypothetical protein